MLHGYAIRQGGSCHNVVHSLKRVNHSCIPHMYTNVYMGCARWGGGGAISHKTRKTPRGGFKIKIRNDYECNSTPNEISKNHSNQFHIS